MSDAIEKACALIRDFESLQLTAYHGKADRPGLLTIGYGHTGPDVVDGLVITAARAEELLAEDLATRAAAPVARMVRADLSTNQLAALLSFTFNEGEGHLAQSTLLRLLNSGAPSLQIADEFLRWDKAQGREVDGLERRRVAERALFLL